jgi:hypothetical protein
LDPLIRWLDCDHQAGGAWQTCKMKLDSFVQQLDQVQEFGPEGRALLESMQRFVPRDRLNEIEAIAEHLPEHYKALIASEPSVDKQPAWEQELGGWGLKGVIAHFTESLAGDAKTTVSNLVLDYLLRRVNKKDFNTALVACMQSDKELKRRSLTLKRWLEHAELGVKLFWTYLDYIVNYPARPWQTILDHGYSRDPEDILLLLTRQPKTEQPPRGYAHEIKKVAKYPREAGVEVSIHSELAPWNEIFKT